MILYFVRHGLAAERESWSGADYLRPLTEEGRAKVEESAQTLAKLELGVQLIVTSPLVRAEQTARIIAARLGLRGSLVEDERLAPGFDRARLAELVAAHPQAQVTMLVGHEPDFSDTISDLIGGGRVVCKKGSLARVDVADRSTLEGQLVWLAPPRLLALRG
jgi:phosphohistidine phosphatase